MNIYTSEKMVRLEKDINPRIATNFNYYITSLKSDIYFEMNNRCINAKSLLGILSLSLREDDILNIKTESVESAEIAQHDLKKVLAYLECEINTK